MARTAIQDVNEGRTNIGARAATSAKIAVYSPGVSVKQDSIESAVPIVKATTQALETTNKMYQASAAQDAAMRQGSAEGVNEVDQANKRGKFMSFLFGQDAGYSTAVSIASKNFAQNEYLRQMGSVDEYIDKTPEEYQQYINDNVTKSLEDKFGSDPEAKAIAMDQWTQQSRKLAREHTAKHMVYAQEQTFGEGVRDLTGQFDDIAMNTQPGSTQAAQTEALAELTEILNPNYRYVADDGAVASKVASRNIQLKAVTQQLAAGNFTVLKALPENFKEGMTVTQMNTLDQAFQQYDNAQARKGELIVEQGLLAAEYGNMTGMQEALQMLELQKNKLSGSSTSLEKWTEDKRRLKGHMNTMLEKQAKSAAKEQDFMMYFQARENSNSAEQGQYYTKENEKKADDAVVMIAAANMANELGQEAPKDIGEAIQFVMDNPTALQSVAIRAERYGSISEPLAEAVKSRIMNLRPDEYGFLSNDDLSQLDNLRVLYNMAPGQMRKALGADGSAMLEITLNNSREPVKEIQNKRANYTKNKDLRGSKNDFGIHSSVPMQDWVKKQLGTEYLDPAAVTYYTEQLQTGYRVYSGDTKAAINYMKQQFKINDKQWKGKTIRNAGIIDTEVDVPKALYQLEDTGYGQALIESRIPEWNQDPANPIRSLSDLKDVQFSVNPGNNDLTISSSMFSYPIVIDANVMESLAVQADNKARERQAASEKANLAVLKEQSQQFWPTPSKGSNKTTQMWPTP